MINLNNLNNLEKISKVWQIQLNIEYSNPNHNTRISFKDIGSFCELLATDYNAGYVGCGSGGMGFDLVNYATKKAVEVKSCCTIQNAKCTSCGTKFNSLFSDKCPKCSSTEYKKINDSRFGIDAKEFLNQYDKGYFDNFTICHISLVNQDKVRKELTVCLEWFRIDFKDTDIREIQLKYFENQASLGRKPHCNLLPFSFDFYKLCPVRIGKKHVLINYGDLNSNPVVSDQSFEREVRVPISVIPKDKETEFKNCETFKNLTVEVKDFTQHVDYKKKNLGKERGDTRGSVYNALK